MGRSIAKITLAIANKREKERLRAIKDGIIAKVQADLEDHTRMGKKWPYVNYWNEKNYKSYDRNSFLSHEYTERQLEVSLKELGFDCKIREKDILLAIPMWEKGEKKTTAQLMLYHHLKGFKKATKEMREKQEAMAKEDFQYVLAQLKSGNFESESSQFSYRIRVELKKGEERTGEFYSEKLKGLMNKCGFKMEGDVGSDGKLTFYLSKD